MNDEYLCICYHPDCDCGDECPDEKENPYDDYDPENGDKLWDQDDYLGDDDMPVEED